eukprot:901826-Amphidinium_carterae.1
MTSRCSQDGPVRQGRQRSPPYCRLFGDLHGLLSATDASKRDAPRHCWCLPSHIVGVESTSKFDVSIGDVQDVTHFSLDANSCFAFSLTMH